MISYWWGISTFILVPHHLMLDSWLLFWGLLLSINMLTFLPTFTNILSISWSALQDAMPSLCQLLIWFLTTYVLLLTCKFHQTIVGLSHKLSSTGSYLQSALKPSRLISKILSWLDTLKLTQLDWLNNTTVSSTFSSIFIYLQSAVHVFTTSGIHSVFAVSLIWIVQNCLRML